ncbi:MAG: Rid family hydrolase [Thermoguttaceae bacterium]
MIRKHSSLGVGYSAVELDGVRHVFVAAAPWAGITLSQQADSALQTVSRVIAEEGLPGAIVQQAVFLAQADQIDPCRQIIREFYGPDLPATTYVPQRPCGGKLLAIEALGVGCQREEVQIERISEQLVIARHSGMSFVHASHVVPEVEATGCYQRSLSAFWKMERLLASAGVGYDQVLRTWLYLGGIVDPEGPTQRYKELNRARTDFYQRFRFAAGLVPPGVDGEVYPASTGIGADHRDVLLSCIALVTQRQDVAVVPLENPRQVSAYCYSSAYGPKSPKFSRALVLTAADCAMIFISGTASITDSESQHPGDVEAQTNQTLDNIEALISEENLARHGLAGLGATLADLALARVYVKRPEDCQKARRVCTRRLGELPTIYAVADVCRPELLVEIEGIAFSRRPGR